MTVGEYLLNKMGKREYGKMLDEAAKLTVKPKRKKGKRA